MKTVDFAGSIEQAYGQTIAKLTGGRLTKLEIKGKFQAYESADEVKADYKEKDLDELILQSANAAAKANERAKETNQALLDAGIEKPKPNDPEVAFERMVKDLMFQNQKLTRERAEKVVRSMLAAE